MIFWVCQKLGRIFLADDRNALGSPRAEKNKRKRHFAENPNKRRPPPQPTHMRSRRSLTVFEEGGYFLSVKIRGIRGLFRRSGYHALPLEF